MYIINLLGETGENVDIEKAVNEANKALARPVENNVADKCPALVNEWDCENNNGLKPESFTCGSKRKIKWKCSKCHREWSVSITSRIRFKTGCPFCGYNVFDGRVHEHAIKKRVYIRPKDFL